MKEGGGGGGVGVGESVKGRRDRNYLSETTGDKKERQEQQLKI